MKKEKEPPPEMKKPPFSKSPAAFNGRHQHTNLTPWYQILGQAEREFYACSAQ